jgi:hypothetical protein
MERSNFRLPDAINCSTPENFTCIPNDLIRNPEITGKAKALLCLLLSNHEGWYSYLTSIQTMMKEQYEALSSGLKELEEYGYLKRFKYRDKISKRWKGTLWIYTNIPFKFEYEKQLRKINLNGYEAVDPQTGFPVLGDSVLEDQRLIISNNNNNINNNKKSTLSPENPSKEKNKMYLPLAEILSKIITSNKKIYHTPSQINGWANEIRRLVETSKIAYKRVEKALEWYKSNYGGKYIPVIESGSSLREKFLRLEAAMEKDGYRDNNEKEKNYEPTILPNRIKNAYKETEEEY